MTQAFEFKTRDDSIASIMYRVTGLLLPGIAAMVWFFGINVLVQIILAVTTALITESLVLALRKREILVHIFDGSAILTAVLLALSIPPIAPWWVIVVGVVFSVIFGKQLYGGLGNNIFNPAMVGYVILIISFPKQMTLWSQVHYQDSMSFWGQIQLIFSLSLNDASQSVIDSITGATPLGGLDSALSKGTKVGDYLSSANANSKTAWLVINIMFLLGGLLLWFVRLIDSYISLTFLAGLSFTALLFHGFAPDNFAPLSFHLFSGATMIGAFFIATDPVSASTTPIGRLIYGFCIGVILYFIRAFGSFHDAVAFAVLFMNMMAPLIDAYTTPKTVQKKL